MAKKPVHRRRKTPVRRVSPVHSHDMIILLAAGVIVIAVVAILLF